jgi:hypothetical protein
MDIFVLIIVIGLTSSQSGGTSISQEFFSRESCENARADIVRQTELQRPSIGTTAFVVRVHGCYKK